MPQQIFVVHGGEVFEKYEEYLEYLKNYQVNLEKVKNGGWKDHLQETLGNEYDVIFPQMENYHNAKYSEWKIFFERFFPYLKDGIILIGGSLGGIFLAKYLSENILPIKIKAIFLLAAPHSDDYLGDFSLPESLEKVSEQSNTIFLYHSEDDPVVNISEVEKYSALLPKAEKVIFENKGHFNLKEFPEILDKIKDL